ncbi:MAG TPA: response regulator transcription factor [Ramlibacter sp.]|jgi:two-component system response regulator TctD|uniref:response regulator transcription factor n=1 Tax=Ramlibacter sp. TaxID=1917967 RepID=UPI002D743D3D|nr:response regulator transcription factor [Ramlibacter sp.]HZY19473.1 response regulator transcription factor [Ramlibacter sp.]
MKVLLVEDDPSMRAALERTLARRGLAVDCCGDGAHALARWRMAPPDVVVLDLSLPGLDGLQVLESARRDGLATPVLILTARGTVGDRVVGLNAGADDYLPKPFDLDELEARLRALGRRRGEAAAPPEDLHVADLRLDRASGAVYHGAQVLELTPREAALLQALMARPGHAVSKERLFELVFPGEQDVHPEAVEVVVYRLRKKLQGTAATLMTLRGLGYLIKAA